MKEKIKTKLSNTKLKFRVKRKTNPEISETIFAANENPNWRSLAKILSGATRLYSSINLSDIDKQASAGDTILVPGKVLGSGDLTKKVRICALAISNSAKEKLKSTKSEYVSILQEINSNKKAEGVKILR